MPNSHAGQRDWAFPQFCNLNSFPGLLSCWQRSRATLATISKHLQAGQVDKNVACVAISGSLGRMEQSASSDCDLIVLLQDDVPTDSAQAGQAYASVWKALSPLELGAPKATGIYATPTTRGKLLDAATLGRVAEDLTTFGQRFQLLLDCQPVYGPNVFGDVVQGILKRYWSGVHFLGDEPSKYLLDDLLRYFRSLSVNYRWEDRHRPGRWRLRNTKLRHNRLLNYVGLLFLLGENSRQADDIGQLQHSLMMTPLERVAWAYAANQDRRFEVVAECYDRFLALYNDAKFYARLTTNERQAEDVQTTQAAIDGSPADNEPFVVLQENSQRLRSELRRFSLQQMEVWSENFVDGLFF